jgi:Zn-dependent metalloprotease
MKASAVRVFFLPVSLAVVVCILFSSCHRKAKSFDDIAQPILTPGWITFKESAKVDPTTLFRDYAGLFHLTEGNEMHVQSQESDDLGLTHFRYQQYYKGIEVENAEFLVHAKSGVAIRANGILAADFQPENTEAKITEEQALAILRQRFPEKQFLHEDNLVKDVEAQPQQLTPRPYSPKGRLVFTEIPGGSGRVLAWVFRAYVSPINQSRQVYIDAMQGRIVKEFPLMADCFPGNGPTTFRGLQNFNTGKANIPNVGERFVLLDDCHANRLRYMNPTAVAGTREVSDSDNNWIGNDMPAVTSYWGLGIVYDYYDLVLKRRSYDNKNGDMTIINDPAQGQGAQGGNGTIWIGTANPGANDDYNPVDIIGHEFTHSVTETSAKLAADNTKESNALNESFSDILGKMSQRWEERNVNSADWVIGNEKGCSGTGQICRNLKNPKAFNQPDYYNGIFWQSSNIDPHNNGTVQNRWFSLLADGGTGSDEKGIPFSVNGVGIDKATKIAFRTLTRYLTANSAYVDSRDGSIAAAQDLYGYDSAEQAEVAKAWCAVGLCPYSLPKLPDIFDRPGGNPNPASPNNNNSMAGATPLGTGSYIWSADNHPKLTVSDLSIYPLGDVDYFQIKFPAMEHVLGGRCFTPGFAFSLGMYADATLYVGGIQQTYFHSVASITIGVPVAEAGDVVLKISPAFPGQIFNYSLKASFFLHYDDMCFQTRPPNKWDLVRECIMCDFHVLKPGDDVILDPFYRTKEGVDQNRSFFNWQGEGATVSIPIKVVSGNRLSVELVNENGEVVASNQSQGAGTLAVKAPRLQKGIYSLRFSGFGNGTKLQVQAPR